MYPGFTDPWPAYILTYNYCGNLFDSLILPVKPLSKKKSVFLTAFANKLLLVTNTVIDEKSLVSTDLVTKTLFDI